VVTAADSNGKKIQSIFFKILSWIESTAVCNKYSRGGRPPQKGGNFDPNLGLSGIGGGRTNRDWYCDAIRKNKGQSMTKSQTLREEKEYIRKRRAGLLKRRELLIKMSGPGEINAERSYVDADAIHGGGGRREAYSILIEIAKIEADLQALNELEQNNAEQLAVLREAVAHRDKLAEQIPILRDIEGMSLKEIAEELGYSYDWVRHVAVDIKMQGSDQ
jgi:DNA-directed RNA polymerase specialized sigma24 family protein